MRASSAPAAPRPSQPRRRAPRSAALAKAASARPSRSRPEPGRRRRAREPAVEPVGRDAPARTSRAAGRSAAAGTSQTRASVSGSAAARLRGTPSSVSSIPMCQSSMSQVSAHHAANAPSRRRNGSRRASASAIQASAPAAIHAARAACGGRPRGALLVGAPLAGEQEAPDSARREALAAQPLELATRPALALRARQARRTEAQISVPKTSSTCCQPIRSRNWLLRP